MSSSSDVADESFGERGDEATQRWLPLQFVEYVLVRLFVWSVEGLSAVLVAVPTAAGGDAIGQLRRRRAVGVLAGSRSVQ